MASGQKKIFLDNEGDGWYKRNKITGEKLAQKKENDLVLSVLKDGGFLPKNVLEIGASNGWRLHVLKEKWPNAHFSGIEPSAQAVADAYSGIEMKQGTAESLPYEDNAFDMVIFGFCLYLCDRRDLFQIAAEADRVLTDGGHIVLYDFYSTTPYKNPYAHQAGLYSYKMDYSRLFNWNPGYRLLQACVQPHPGYEDRDTPDNRVAVHIFQKKMTEAFPDSPYSK